MNKVCPQCENYQFHPMKLEKTGDWIVRSDFYTGDTGWYQIQFCSNHAF